MSVRYAIQEMPTPTETLVGHAGPSAHSLVALLEHPYGEQFAAAEEREVLKRKAGCDWHQKGRE
jgi:hypothetical protein